MGKPKNKVRESAVFNAPKPPPKNTINYHAFTTNSPRFYQHKTPKNRKTASKKPLSRPIIFSAKKTQKSKTPTLTFALTQPIGKAGEPACCAESCITQPHTSNLKSPPCGPPPRP